MSHPRHAEPLPLGNDQQPYSKGLMARALVAVGIPIGRAYELAKRIEQDLAGRNEESVELDRFEQLAMEVLGEPEGSRALHRLRRFQQLQELDLPVIVLVGGATGTGKSTVATEAAYRLVANHRGRLASLLGPKRRGVDPKRRRRGRGSS